MLHQKDWQTITGPQNKRAGGATGSRVAFFVSLTRQIYPRQITPFTTKESHGKLLQRVSTEVIAKNKETDFFSMKSLMWWHRASSAKPADIV